MSLPHADRIAAWHLDARRTGGAAGALPERAITWHQRNRGHPATGSDRHPTPCG